MPEIGCRLGGLHHEINHRDFLLQPRQPRREPARGEARRAPQLQHMPVGGRPQFDRRIRDQIERPADGVAEPRALRRELDAARPRDDQPRAEPAFQVADMA